MIDAEREAEAGWRRAANARLPSRGDRAVLASAVAVGAVTAVLVARALSEAAGAGVLVTGAAIALAVVAVPLWRWRARAARVEDALFETKRRSAARRCPRCDASLPAPSVDATCACGARRLEAAGLVIAYSSDPELRSRRWYAVARRRLPPTSEPSWALQGASWTLAGVLALFALFALTELVAPDAVSAPLGLAHEPARPRGEGVANAASEDDGVPPGPATRPHPPLHVGTQVLARVESSRWFQLAVITRRQGRRAFVVFADGSSTWTGQSDVLAPELATGDPVEVWDGARWVPATITDRLGPALQISGATQEWTTVARVRVRVDARHEAGTGRRFSVPRSAWVEAQEGDVWRPGLVVATDGLRSRVALEDGRETWLEHDAVRAQTLGPGARVFVDGEPGEWIVASRIGHALSVVSPSGETAWTALSRVRR